MEDHSEILLLGDSLLYHAQRFPNVTFGHQIRNMCIPGQKSIQLHDDLEFFKDHATDHLPITHPYRQMARTIVIHIGTNDLPLFMQHSGSISERLISIVELIKDRIQRTCPPGYKKVYILGLLPREHKNDPESFRDDIKDINTILEENFRGQGIYIKPPQSLADAEGKVKDHFFHTDKLHLSEKGLDEVFSCIFDFLGNPYNHIVKRYRSKEQLEESRCRRLRRRRLAESRLVWCDNRRWSDWVF